MFESLGTNTNWQIQSLGDFMEIKGDSWIDIDDTVDYQILGVTGKGSGLVIKRKVSGAELKMRQYQVARLNQLMWCKVDTTNGAFGITKSNHVGALSSPNMCLADIDVNKCLPEFLQLFFRLPTVYEGITTASLGTTNRQYLKPQELLKQVCFHVPPIDEQRRIVAHVESLAARVNEAQRLREEAEKEAKALLYSAQNEVFGSKPKSNWVLLSYYVAEIRNGKSPNCEKRQAKLSEWGVLKVGAVSFGTFDEKQNKALPPTLQPNPEYEVKAGDFLMIRANTTELVGACAIVEKTRPRLLISDKTFRFVFREDNVIEKRYLNHVLKSPALRTQIEQQATGTSPTMKNISKGKVMELKVPCTPLDEQRHIVAYLDGLQAKVNALREVQSASGEELSALMPSVLDRAFKGEL